MKAVNKFFCGAALLAAGGLLAANANASVVTMTFDDLTVAQGGGQYVADFYNGGCGASFSGGAATCGGPDYGVVWSGPTVARGPLNIPSAFSSPNAIMRATPVGTPLGIAPMTMNVANGFTDGFSFHYATLTAPQRFTVTFWGGPDGTGTNLGSYTFRGCGTPAGLYTCWQLADGFTFADPVYSVAFGGEPRFVIDSVSFDQRTPPVAVPEPASLGVFGFGALLIGGFMVLRRRRTA